MLRLNSKPIRTTSELRKIITITTIILPIEPYKILYLPKLFTKAEKAIVAIILNRVAVIAPGETSFHLFVVDGAYL
jgi:hypothetical protein